MPSADDLDRQCRTNLICDLDAPDYDFVERLVKEMENVDPRLKREFCNFMISSARVKRNEISLKLGQWKDHDFLARTQGEKKWNKEHLRAISDKINLVLEENSQ